MSAAFEPLGRDVRYGFRSLTRTPGFTALAVASLALGIMATTAIYSVLHAVVLDPFPYKDVGNLMSVLVTNLSQRGGRLNYSIDQFLELSERNTIFDGVIASTVSDVLWTSSGDPQRLRGNIGTFNTFDVMGVQPLVGRTPNEADAQPGAEPVVVLGYKFWQRQFGGDPGVLGRQLHLNDTTRTVIGVMPKRFMWRGADVYLPTHFVRGQFPEGVRNVHVLGRLKPGVSAAAAQADLTPIIEDLKRREPTQFPDKWRVGILSFEETFPSSIGRDIWVLLGAVGLLLLIACANVSNLLLSRAGERQREMTVRTALGASRGRIIRQLLTESLLLALAAGVLGTALAYVGLPAILSLVPPDTIPDEAEIALNTQVLIFALIVSALTAVVCGLAPALHTANRDLARSMREASRSLAGHSRQALIRKSFVVAEVALSLVLLAGSGVLLRTFLTMSKVDLGYDPERIMTMRVPLPAQRYPDRARRVTFFEELLPRITAVPGVAAVGLNTGLHPLGNMWSAAEISGETPRTEPVQVHQVNADYQRTFNLQLTAGRALTSTDVTSARPVALVNETFVRARIPSRPALGNLVRLPRLRQPPFVVDVDSFEIVGVVRDTRNNGLTEPPMPEIYIPYTAAGFANGITVRAAVDPAAITRAVVSQVYAIDKGQPVSDVMTLETVLRDNQYATPRFNLVLLSAFAIVGLVLAVVGVYGVMSSAVAQERQEIGIRMALGAERRAIVQMILIRGVRLLLAGAALGLVGSYAAGRYLAGEVWNVRGFDPLAFVAVALVLLGAGIQACLWPALRAAKIDPIVALRQD
jgi:predicted permease